MNSHLRKDILSSNWVIVSNDREFRPNEYRAKIKCPFCPGNEKETPPAICELKDLKGWYIRVVPNKYPALTLENKNFQESEGLNKKFYVKGHHEVIIEDRNHFKKINEIKHLDKVLEIYALRMKELYSLKNVKYVMLFRNYGQNAGASLIHPHSQIISMPLLPLRVSDELKHFKTYHLKNKKCAMCDILSDEKKFKKRIIFENSHFVAFAPFASRFNFEIWVSPVNHEPDFYKETEFKKLSEALKNVFSKLHYSIKDLSYNMIIHTAPSGEKKFHWHIEILPKIAMPAGFEWGSGFYINSLSPERISEILNKGIKFRY